MIIKPNRKVVAPAGGGGGIALVASATPAAGTTAAINTTGANLIVIGASSYSGGAAPSCSDSKGNTWTPLTLRTSGTTYNQLFYCVNPTVGAGHTFTVAGSFQVTSVFAFSGLSGSPFVSQTGAANVNQPGSITPASSGSLLVTSIANSGGAITGIDSGFSQIHLNYGTGVNMGGGIAYLIQSIAAPVNPTWSHTGADPTVTMACFH